MAIHVIEEANRCLQCKVPRCQQGCPIHTNVPQMIRLFKESQVEEAAQMLFENNPLSVVCSLVCDHASQCEGHCVRGLKGEPVHISSIENYISDSALERVQIPKKADNGMKAAVIGAGPAGITISMILASRGYKVTVFESRDQIGGIMRYGIPEFRLPKSLLERYQKLLEAMGIQIRLNTTIGTVLLIDNLFRDGYASVFIGTGAEKPRCLGIQGESLGNVHFGLNYLANPAAHHLGDTVAVIGMGNAAMDVARTALRNGSRRVMLFSRDNTIAASSNEVSYAKLDGAEFVFGKQIHHITEEGPVFQTSILDEEGKVVGYEEELELVEADSTIISISQVPRTKLVRTTDGLESTEGGVLIVDENYMTTRPGVFAAGDVVTGAKTVVHAVEGAKAAAQAMMRYMQTQET